MELDQVSCACGERLGVDMYFDVASVRDYMARCGASAADAAAIREIVLLEWGLFDRVKGLDGRAGCQDDARSFFVYRLAQYLAFPLSFAHRALTDLKRLSNAGRNPLAEKYARMMAVTDPDLYDVTWRQVLSRFSPVRACALHELKEVLEPLASDASARMPAAAAHARVSSSAPQEVSAVDYIVGEVAPYSLGTIWHLRDDLRARTDGGGNPIIDAYVHACAINRLAGV